MTDADNPQSPMAYVDRLLAATEDWRIRDCDALCAEARARLDPDDLVQRVYSPLLREVGDRWERGQLSIVQEHLLTSAVRRQLLAALDEHNRRSTGPRIAFTTLSGERHEIGSLMLAVLAASGGVHAIYLGPDLPAAEIGRFCARVQVSAVAVSIVTRAEVIDAQAQLARIAAVLPPAVELWIGGHASAALARSELPARVSVVRDLGDFNTRVGQLSGPETSP